MILPALFDGFRRASLFAQQRSQAGQFLGPHERGRVPGQRDPLLVLLFPFPGQGVERHQRLSQRHLPEIPHGDPELERRLQELVPVNRALIGPYWFGSVS